MSTGWADGAPLVLGPSVPERPRPVSLSFRGCRSSRFGTRLCEVTPENPRSVVTAGYHRAKFSAYLHPSHRFLLCNRKDTAVNRSDTPLRQAAPILGSSRGRGWCLKPCAVRVGVEIESLRRR